MLILFPEGKWAMRTGIGDISIGCKAGDSPGMVACLLATCSFLLAIIAVLTATHDSFSLAFGPCIVFAAVTKKKKKKKKSTLR
eukprot:NODE_188_length_1881_cov_162.853712_g142_i0.p8 GENE.NODE_188_length_1881_cov_162.853712_g142_i0~~NODE_188_length_1881_cov_162.853712_g142_i0.p8  ORF type:complete len:83 (+),score=23.00 NODE_188_length_1881_cov_162.853712_g142_i0:1632-1880(+)